MEARNTRMVKVIDASNIGDLCGFHLSNMGLTDKTEEIASDWWPCSGETMTNCVILEWPMFGQTYVVGE